MLEDPVKTITPGGTGCSLSCRSKARIVDSHSCANTVARNWRKPIIRRPRKRNARTADPLTTRLDVFRITEEYALPLIKTILPDHEGNQESPLAGLSEE